MEERYQALLAECSVEFPGFAVIRKVDSPFQRAIHYTLLVLTFGGQRSYLDSYQTTIGRKVYVSRDWDHRPAAERWATLRHERVHLRQFRRYTVPLMATLYLGVLPAGLAYFRARFEKEAYEESLRAWAEAYGPEYLRRPEVREHVIRQFTGPAYGWMWPFPRAVASWYERAAAAAVRPHVA